MKLRLLVMIALCALIQMSCALLNGGKGQEAAQPEVAAETATLIADTATPAPTQPVESPSPTEAPATVTEAATSTPEESPSPTATTGRAQVTLPAPQPGPETLDLDNSPDLFKNPLVEYISRVQDDTQGEDPNGQPSSITLRFQTRYQVAPVAGWDTVAAFFSEDAAVETVQLGGKQYTVSDGTCSEVEPGAPPQSPVGALEGILTGKARRVAQGVDVNGLPADQYAIEKVNLKDDPKATFITESSGEGSTNSATMSVTLTGSGSLYVAQQGGFVIKLEMNDSAKATDEMPFFKPGSNLTRATLFELAPISEDDEPIALPEACAGLESTNPADEGGQATAETPPSSLDLPRPENAEVLTDTGDYQVLSVPGTVDAIEQFYKTELEAQGFGLQSADKTGPIVELIFEKDGVTVDITIIASGESVMITIVQN